MRPTSSSSAQCQYEKEYRSFWSIADAMPVRNTGIQTKRDDLLYHFSKADLSGVLKFLTDNPPDAVKAKFKLAEDGRDWRVAWAQKDVQSSNGKC